jgi:hypothetical protein
VAATLAVAAGVSGCGANVDFDNKDAWFSKPFQLVSQSGGYTFSELAEAKQRQHPITPNDLVNSNGSCAPPAAQQPAPAPPGNQVASAAPPATTDATAMLGGGVALGMTECEIVFRAGPPSSVQIGNNPNGDRTAVLTFNSGPRPGIYHFERGALMEMDRVAQPAPPPNVKKKASAKSAKPQKKNDQT